MKRVWRCLAFVLLLCMTALCFFGCQQKNYLEGMYVAESGSAERVFVFSEELLVMIELIDTETVEFHYTYEITKKENSDAEQLVLTYKGLVYDGNDPYVSWYLTGQRQQYAKDPVIVSDIERGNGYFVINEQKYVLQG